MPHLRLSLLVVVGVVAGLGIGVCTNSASILRRPRPASCVPAAQGTGVRLVSLPNSDGTQARDRVRAVEVAPETPADALLTALEGALRHPDDASGGVHLCDVEEHLAALLAQDPGSLEPVLRRFRSAAGTELGEALAVILGSTNSSAVQAFALDLAARGTTDPERAAGLDLLDRLGCEGPEARRVVVDLLRSPASPGLLAEALFVLRGHGASLAEAREVIDVLGALTAHADSEVRRRAVIVLAEWAPDGVPFVQGR